MFSRPPDGHRVGSVKIAALAGVAAALAGGSLHVTVKTATEKPKAGTHWAYTVTATHDGKPAKATVTAQIVDPLGGVHPVGFGAKKGNVTKVPFTGTFRDFVIWPKSSVGYPLKFRVIVAAGGARSTSSTTVTVHS
jgi:hypothetical protein